MPRRKWGRPAALVTSARRVGASDEFAVQTYASLGPSFAVADFIQGQFNVWSALQATHLMQRELAGITVIALEKVRLAYLICAGCFGRNSHEDATANLAHGGRQSPGGGK